MSDWWVHEYWSQSPVLLLSWVVWVIVSIVLHELGHGYAAEFEGDPTPRSLGHLTLNPAVHITGFAWVLFAFVGITWGLMPIDPRRFRHGRWSRALVAFAGPAVNILLALLLIILTACWIKYAHTTTPTTYSGVMLFLRVGAVLNVVLAMFNLLPLPPLDGSAIAAAAIRPLDRWLRDPAIAMRAFAVLIVLGFLGAFSFIGRFGWRITDATVLEVAARLP